VPALEYVFFRVQLHALSLVVSVT